VSYNRSLPFEASTSAGNMGVIKIFSTHRCPPTNIPLHLDFALYCCSQLLSLVYTSILSCPSCRYFLICFQFCYYSILIIWSNHYNTLLLIFISKKSTLNYFTHFCISHILILMSSLVCISFL
jgi:hypothetical protein